MTTIDFPSTSQLASENYHQVDALSRNVQAPAVAFTYMIMQLMPEPLLPLFLGSSRDLGPM